MTLSTHAAISITALDKSFSATKALDGLDLTVAAGEVHGFLGPNGSGKTTTIRVLLGLLRADSGELRMLGGDPWRDAVSLHGCAGATSASERPDQAGQVLSGPHAHGIAGGCAPATVRCCPVRPMAPPDRRRRTLDKPPIPARWLSGRDG